MKLEQASPPPPLRDHVRCFQQRRAKIGDTPIVYPITARTDQFLEFYLQGRYVVRFGEAGRQELAPRAVVVGPSTRRLADLVLRAELDVFTVQFRPAGFYKLFGTPMNEFADQAYDAHSVIGPVLAELEQRLADASSFEERTCVAGDFLRQRLDEIGRPDGVSEFADRFLVGRGAISVGDAALKADSASASSNVGFAGKSALRPNSTPGSSGSTPPSRPRRARRGGNGPISPTRSDITTKCT